MKKIFAIIICFVLALTLTSLNINTVYAEATIITLDGNGETTSGTTLVTATYGDDMPTPITLPTKTGYTFMGYFETSDSAGEKYYNADGSSAHGWDKSDFTSTLYARWGTALFYWYDSVNKTLHLSNNQIDSNYLEDTKYEGVYADISQRPWNSIASNITDVVIENELIPSSTAYWLYGFTNLQTINNLSNLNTSNVTHMHWMFAYCNSLVSLDLTSFNTSKVTTMAAMFIGCSSLKSVNLSSFNTCNVMHVDSMFQNCSSLEELDLHSFDTAKVGNMNGMFVDCSSLKKIIVLESFVTSGLSGSAEMFYGCTNLVGGNGTAYDSTCTDSSYARIDKDGAPGYFTKYVKPSPTPTPIDNSCEIVIGPRWHWNNEKGVCQEDYSIVDTAAK